MLLQPILRSVKAARFSFTRGLSTLASSKSLQEDLHKHITAERWENNVFDDPSAGLALTELYRNQRIKDNIFSVLIARQQVVQGYYKSQLSPSQLSILRYSEQPTAVKKYLEHPIHAYRLRFLKHTLKDPQAVTAFQEFLQEKLQADIHNKKHFYYFNYQVDKENFSEVLDLILNYEREAKKGDEYKNQVCAHMFFPVPEITHTDRYSGIAFSLDFMQFVYDSLSEFLRLKSGNSNFMPIKLRLALNSLKPEELAHLHSKMEHPVGIETLENPTDFADGLGSTAFCYAFLHDAGFHTYRLLLQSGFSRAAKLIVNSVYAFYRAKKETHPREYEYFQEANILYHPGKLAQVLTDQEIVHPTMDTAESVYACLLKPIVNGAYSVSAVDPMFLTFKQDLTTELLETVIYDCYKSFSPDEFSNLMQVMLRDNPSSAKRSMMHLDVVAISTRLSSKHPDDAFAKKLQAELLLHDVKPVPPSNFEVHGKIPRFC